MIPIHYKIIAGLVCLGVLAGFYGSLYVSRERLRTELAETKAQLETSKMANRTWVQNSKRMNKAVEKMQTEAELMAKTIKEAQNKAAEAAKSHEANACTLMGKNPTGGACEAAQRLVVKFMEGRK